MTLSSADSNMPRRQNNFSPPQIARSFSKSLDCFRAAGCRLRPAFCPLAGLIAAWVLSSLPATSLAAPSGPDIQFQKRSFAFGSTIAGTLLSHDFVFTNSGGADLTITGVYPSCNCTTVNHWTRRIPPGQSGQISLQFDSTRFDGPVSESTVVVNNDAARHNVVLSFVGTVKKPVEVIPPMIILKPVIGGQTDDVCVAEMQNNLPGRITLGEPACNNPAFSAKVKVLEAERKFQLIVRSVPPVRDSMLQGTVSMRTSSDRFPSVTVPVLVLPQLPIYLSPAVITLPSTPLSAPTNVTITLQNRARDPLKLNHAAIDVAGATVQVKESQPGREFILVASFPSGFQLPAKREAALTITTTDFDPPVLRIPLRASSSPTSTHSN